MKKIQIRGGKSWQESQTLCLAVSMAAPHCAGDYFLAALDFAKATGKDFFVDVSDTLHIPNLMAEGANRAEAAVLATAMGDAWIQAHADHLDDVKIIRWSHWHNHPDYQEVHQQFQRLYDQQGKFFTIVNLDADAFIARSPTRNTSQFFQASVAYVIDECAGKTLQGHAYPGLGIL